MRDLGALSLGFQGLRLKALHNQGVRLKVRGFSQALSQNLKEKEEDGRRLLDASLN